jgi:hypothetical protein
MIKTLAFEIRDDGLRKGIGLRSVDRDLFGPDVHVLPELPELQSELRVVIVNEHPRLDVQLLHPHVRIPGLLHHPLLVGIERGRRTEDLAAAEMDEREDVGVELPPDRVDGFREEIARDQGIHVGRDELVPRHRRLAVLLLLRRRVDALFDQNPPDRRMADDVAEFLQLPHDRAAAPAGVLFPYADH